MSQGTYLKAVDRFSDAVAALARNAPDVVRQELHDATGALLEAVASEAAAQSAGAIRAVLDRLEVLEAARSREVGGG